LRRLVTVLSIMLFYTSESLGSGLNPENLKRLVEKNSLDLKLSREQIKQQEFQRRATLREFFPKVNLSFGFQEFYPDFKENWNQNYSYGVSINSEVLNLKRSVELFIDSKEIEELKEALKETFLTVYYEALKELYQLKFYDEQIKIRRTILKNSKEILSVAREKYKQGLVMVTDVLKAESEVKSAESSLIEAENDYRKKFAELNALLDFSLKKVEKPDFEFSDEPIDKTLKELLKTAFKLRPEIKKAEEKVRIERERVKLVKRNLSPTLSISLSAERSGTEFPGDKSYSAGITLSYPIFDSGETKYRVLSQKSSLIQSELNLKKVKNSVKLEVINALSDVESAYKKLTSAKSSLKYLQKAYDRALNEYKLGVSDIVLLLQTFNSLKEAEENYVKALYEYNLSIVSLKKATGELVGGKN
jgi:outer membrane protein TolC